jgi:hypothetical protein
MTASQKREETNMYGTIGRFRIKAGMEGRFRQLIEGQAPTFEAGHIPGFIASYSYRTDADPNDAKPLEYITWKDYRTMVGDTWVPGSNVPFDAVAAKLASESKTKVLYLNGRDLENAEKALDGQKFVGTTIA